MNMNDVKKIAENADNLIELIQSIKSKIIEEPTDVQNIQIVNEIATKANISVNEIAKME